MRARPDITTVARPSPIRRTQTLFTIVAILAAILWCVFHAARGDQSIFNPAHVSFAHKNFEQQCWQCHDGGANGLISQKVSDTACLKCHTAAIHANNQKMGTGHSHADMVVAVSGDNTYPHGMRSSDCMVCHVEHRGPEVLAAKTDQTCLRCHQNLKDFAASPTTVANSVTEFAMNKHPAFGSSTLKDGKHLNTTVLKFNHLLHSNETKGADGTMDCQRCHSKDGDGNMKPVKYADNCASCHVLQVKIGSAKENGLSVNIKHQELSKVREEIKALPGMFIATAAALPKESLYKGTLPTAPAKKAAALRNGPFYTPFDFVQEKLTAFGVVLSTFDTPYPQQQKLALVLGKTPPTFTATTQASGTPLVAPNADLIESYVVYSGFGDRVNYCAFCHEVTGDFPAVVAAGKGTATIVTSRTNVAAVDYLKSKRFNHDLHKSESCVSCHSQYNDYHPVTQPAGTMDSSTCKKTDKQLRLGKPQDWDAEQLAETSRLLDPTEISKCTTCHNPPATVGHKASSTCFECHDYHDRLLERLPIVTATSSPPVPPGPVAASH